MAKRKAAHREEVQVTVVPSPGMTPQPAPRRRSMGRYKRSRRGTSGSSGTGGIAASARKAASTARKVASEEPMRAGVGFVAGNVIGKVAGDMIHDQALETAKKTPEKAAEQARNRNLYGGVMLGATALASALIGGKSTVRKYILHTALNGSSHMLGESAAIDRQMQKPLPPKATQGTDGTEGNDPFDGRDETGASRRERVAKRRQAYAKKIAAHMRAEDPDGTATEGPELEGYLEGLLEDAGNRIEGAEDAMAETGVLPLLAAAALNPETIKALSKLINLAKPEGEKEVKAAQQQGQQPVTAAVLELEGVDPDEVGASAKEQARALRAEAKRLEKAEAQKRRAERIQRRQERRAARKGQPLTIQPQAQALPAPAPVIIREVVRTVSPQADDPIIVVPTDDEVMDVAEGRPLRIRLA